MPVTLIVSAHDFDFFGDTARALEARLPRAELVELDWAGGRPSSARKKAESCCSAPSLTDVPVWAMDVPAMPVPAACDGKSLHPAFSDRPSPIR